MIKPAYSVSFLLPINIFVWQNVLFFPNYPRNIKQCEVYENYFVHVPTNCVKNIVGKPPVTKYLDKRTRDL